MASLLRLKSTQVATRIEFQILFCFLTKAHVLWHHIKYGFKTCTYTQVRKFRVHVCVGERREIITTKSLYLKLA